MIVSPPTDILAHKIPEQGVGRAEGVVIGGLALVEESVEAPPFDEFGKGKGRPVKPGRDVDSGDTLPLTQRGPMQLELPIGGANMTDEPPGAVYEPLFGPGIGKGSVGFPFTVTVPPRLTHSRSVQP